VHDRNDLVHFKSKMIDHSEVDKVNEAHERLDGRLKKGITNAIETIDLVMKTLDDLHGAPGYYSNLIREQP
jgi:hypothetical protein